MGKFEGRSIVMESELSALIWSMQACSSLGYRKVISEGDNLSIINYINEHVYSSRCQHLVNSVLEWKSCFLSTSFVHVNRQHNGSADLLGKKSIQSQRDGVYFNRVQVSCIIRFVLTVFNKMFFSRKKRKEF